jgi:hypothetical protein
MAPLSRPSLNGVVPVNDRSYRNSGRSINVWIGLASPGLYVTPTVNSLYVVGAAAIVVVRKTEFRIDKTVVAWEACDKESLVVPPHLDPPIQGEMVVESVRCVLRGTVAVRLKGIVANVVELSSN